MQPIINIATRAARRAGALMLQRIDRLDTLKVAEKGIGNYVSDVDKSAESTIIETIQKAYPEHTILSEESGQTPQESDYLWIIDPLDGTNNFIHGNPNFCISIAIQYRGRTEHAVIYDAIRDELFSATRGQGAKLNDHRIRVSQRNKLEGATISTSLTHATDQYAATFFASQHSLYEQHVALRRSGSIALDLAYVAAGRLDASYTLGAQRWDIEAGLLLVREAGGLASDLNGGESNISEGELLAGNPKSLKHLLQTLRPHYTKKS
ncbi:Inositol-1-monophosphatase [Piscirickettsia salmonis]|uniref:inositol monophosphatase family protein n=1 Tax=Piscirickettsia salmonis TaxID=1238 RepID=UPI000F083ADB|nr:inositol monophosphatase family protein [Piscirickettsia salmonis]RNC78804.1 inositol monophosphatase [Piscirickettsiaceae bacterium NZ-RLO2]QGP49685.1 Inositol-1-monophosphatase [Piscirickettsia salmonis]QGP55290.1 Inositol-1-monophosphatase [Piscirickettsia salmonis]QGP58853.1 Inositol-1-monophosphatase [Piscirickettsia salmonis]QGP64856.1 Inositol-1-monophosphatase [Piscirickettsia salmonis]